MVKNLLEMQETGDVNSNLVQKDLEEEIETYSSILVWKILMDRETW